RFAGLNQQQTRFDVLRCGRVGQKVVLEDVIQQLVGAYAQNLERVGGSGRPLRSANLRLQIVNGCRHVAQRVLENRVLRLELVEEVGLFVDQALQLAHRFLRLEFAKRVRFFRKFLLQGCENSEWTRERVIVLVDIHPRLQHVDVPLCIQLFQLLEVPLDLCLFFSVDGARLCVQEHQNTDQEKRDCANR